MTDDEKRSYALAAAHQASKAVAELLRYAREGADHPEPFGPEEPIEQLLDAAKLALEIAIESDPTDKEDRQQVYAAILKHLEGWIG
jgi:hypothetical protein